MDVCRIWRTVSFPWCPFLNVRWHMLILWVYKFWFQFAILLTKYISFRKCVNTYLLMKYPSNLTTFATLFKWWQWASLSVFCNFCINFQIDQINNWCLGFKPLSVHSHHFVEICMSVYIKTSALPLLVNKAFSCLFLQFCWSGCPLLDRPEHSPLEGPFLTLCCYSKSKDRFSHVCFAANKRHCLVFSTKWSIDRFLSEHDNGLLYKKRRLTDECQASCSRWESEHFVCIPLEAAPLPDCTWSRNGCA